MTTEIRIIQCGDPQADHLEQFKQYASVPDDSRDGVLLKMLKRAMLSVQEFSDTAILPCKFEMTVVDVYRDEYVRLYQGGKTVISVKDEDGNNVDYEREGNSLLIKKHCKALVVIYENEVNIPEAEKLQPVIWQLATAIYDGEDAKAQASILRTCYYIQ